jgi:hypothetical protein
MFHSHYVAGNINNSNTGSQGAARAENKAKSVERDVKGLRADLARTLMICEA